jgi:hypothetical protein
VAQPSEPALGAGREPVERGVGRRTDRDVVGMAEDAVGSERGHDVRPLLGHDGGDPLDEFLRRHAVDRSIGVTQPLVPFRYPTERPPGRHVLGLPDGAERLAVRREPFADVSGAAVGRDDEHEPELRVVRVQRDRTGYAVSVVVGMGENGEQCSWHRRIIPLQRRPTGRDRNATSFPARLRRAHRRQ